MKRFFACLLCAAVPVATACTSGTDTSGADASAPDGGSPGTDDAGDAGAEAGSGLGFQPSNLDNSPELEATLGEELGDLVLSDCGPQIDASENGRAGCDAPGGVYRRIDGSNGVDQKYAVFVARNIRVAEGKTLTVRGDRPVILVALDTIDLAGGIVVQPGTAGGFSPADPPPDGQGPGAGKGSSNTTSGSGGGGAFCGKGGNGGAPTATGGEPYGTPEIIPLQGGSSGGGLFAAKGGGAIQLVAGREIVVQAAAFIDVHGDGAVTGGGAGGAILLEAPVVKVAGSLTANGGSGGAPGGQSGKPGDRSSTPAPGATNAQGINGGNGGAGTQVDGTNGVTNEKTAEGEGSASGGGGAGRIRINTRSGSAEVTGLVSPDLSTSCATQGTLR
jgi:hypothetical protein